MLNDVRYALRLMRRSPGFTGIAVLSLALGIGANTAIYSLLYTIMLRPLPVEHPEQLVEFLRATPGQPRDDGGWTRQQFEYFRDRSHVFSAISGSGFDNLASIRLDGADPETLIAESADSYYFAFLGLKPAIGRLFGPADAPARGDGDVAVISYSYWTTRLRSDPAAIGKRIWYAGEPKTIIGVAPRGYVGPRVGSRTDMWVPSVDTLRILARLKPGITRQQAEAELAVLDRAWSDQHGARNRETRIELEPAGAGLVRVRDRYSKSLVVLMAVVGLLLLLACINMASMLLARSAGRRRELAVRVGLGAARGRLVRQMLTESVVLSAAGAQMGVALAYLGTGVLVHLMAAGRAHERVSIEVQPDLHLLLVTVGIAVLTGLLFGVAPAWYAFRAAPAVSLRHTGSAGDTWFWRWFGKGLVAAQVALSIFLVTAAAVFLGHLTGLRSLNLGFRSDHVLLVTVDPARAGYTRDQLAARYRELIDRMQSIPGVRSASVSGCTPLEGCGSGGRRLIAEGGIEPPDRRQLTNIVFASPRYFETLGTPLLAGREFSFEDAARLRVAILNQTAALRYFGDADPIGRRISVVGDSGQPYEIVGLAADAKNVELRDPAYPTIYFNMFQENRLSNQFELRTAADPLSAAAAVRQIVRDVLPNVPISKMTTLADQVDSNIVPELLIATLSGFFGAIAAVLAGIGLYGLLAFTVARRTNEIGIRMALGATAADVSRLVLRDAVAMVCTGLAIGLPMVIWSRPLAVSLMVDLKPRTAVALTLASVAAIAVALVASYLPARRAARVDPMEALRHD